MPQNHQAEEVNRNAVAADPTSISAMIISIRRREAYLRALTAAAVSASYRCRRAKAGVAVIGGSSPIGIPEVSSMYSY